MRDKDKEKTFSLLIKKLNMHDSMTKNFAKCTDKNCELCQEIIGLGDKLHHSKTRKSTFASWRYLESNIENIAKDRETMTIKLLSQKYGSSYSMMQTFVNRNDINVESNNTKRARENERKVFEYADKGLTNKEISMLTGLHTDTVSKYRAKIRKRGLID